MHLEISISIVEYTCEDYMFAQLIVLWLYLSTMLKVNAEVAQSLEETSIAINIKKLKMIGQGNLGVLN